MPGCPARHPSGKCKFAHSLMLLPESIYAVPRANKFALQVDGTRGQQMRSIKAQYYVSISVLDFLSPP